MGILTWGDRSLRERHALLCMTYVSCSVTTLTTLSVSACTLGMFCCSVRACTDLFNWMAGRVLVRDLCRLITLGGGRQRNTKCVQQKMIPLRYCARPPIIVGGVQMPVGGRTKGTIFGTTVQWVNFSL